MEKFIIEGITAIEIGHFKSYVTADKIKSSGKPVSFSDKQEIIMTVEKVCNKLKREGVTKEEVKEIIEEMKTHPRAELLTSLVL